MDEFIDEEVAQLRRMITEIEEVQRKIRETNCSYDRAVLFSQITRDILKPKSFQREEFTNRVWVGVMNESPNPKRLYGKMSRDTRLSIWFETLDWAWTGQWLVYGFHLNECNEKAPSNMHITPDDTLYYPDRVFVKVPAMIYKFVLYRREIHAIVRYFGFKGEVCEQLVHEGSLFPILEPKLQSWIYRHTAMKIRGHIRRWREHLRFKPGGVGYNESKKSFDKLISH